MRQLGLDEITVVSMLVFLQIASASAGGHADASAGASAIDKVVLSGSRWNPLWMLRGAGAVVEVSREEQSSWERKERDAHLPRQPPVFSFPTFKGLQK